MKSLTSHRVGLSKERMAMFEDMKPNNFEKEEVPQYSEAKNVKKEDNSELDLLYKNVGKTFSRAGANKTPGVYFTVGFISGVIFILLVFGIVALSSKNSTGNEIEVKTAPKTEQAQNLPQENVEEPVSDEKYTIQAGDTLDKIVVKYYGSYNEAKIQQIQEINNISNPSKLQIGQVIIIPAK